MSNLNLQKLRVWVWPWPWTFRCMPVCWFQSWSLNCHIACIASAYHFVCLMFIDRTSKQWRHCKLITRWRWNTSQYLWHG